MSCIIRVCAKLCPRPYLLAMSGSLEMTPKSEHAVVQFDGSVSLVQDVLWFELNVSAAFLGRWSKKIDVYLF